MKHQDHSGKNCEGERDPQHKKCWHCLICSFVQCEELTEEEINYDLVKKLKDAGFPIKNTKILFPTLSELIEACGEEFGHLILNVNSSGDRTWLATASIKIAGGVGEELARVSGYKTPEESVSNLWLKLNDKIKGENK